MSHLLKFFSFCISHLTFILIENKNEKPYDGGKQKKIQTQTPDLKKMNLNTKMNCSREDFMNIFFDGDFI